MWRRSIPRLHALRFLQLWGKQVLFLISGIFPVCQISATEKIGILLDFRKRDLCNWWPISQGNIFMHGIEEKITIYYYPAWYHKNWVFSETRANSPGFFSPACQYDKLDKMVSVSPSRNFWLISISLSLFSFGFGRFVDAGSRITCGTDCRKDFAAPFAAAGRTHFTESGRNAERRGYQRDGASEKPRLNRTFPEDKPEKCDDYASGTFYVRENDFPAEVITAELDYTSP